ncbi:MAG: hypothetical protein EOO73_16765 [Myxococcales bacterium]|nr:MAG: hypothetical protein EOO73_16765 [Myxococcales bacterium]
MRSLIAVVCALSLAAAVGCSKDEAQKVQPETRGKRGENCQARNDCEPGLACLNQICSKNEFDVGVAVKQCDRIECADTSDCCGNKLSEPPAKCASREALCLPTLPGCTTSLRCTDDDSCNGGTCLPGTCSGGIISGNCTLPADCQDLCTAAGTCSLSGGVCTLDSECTYYQYNAGATCITTNRVCNCTNPDYAPASAICTDPECTDICSLRCEDERCVADRSCDVDSDCITFGLPLCDDSRCVQCKTDDDCDEEGDETCDAGVCHKPCQHNEECPLFDACDEGTGECVYVGCSTDRECILAATGVGDGETPGPTLGGEDPRLLKCLPSETKPDTKECKIPCENDGSCGAQSVCDGGYCKFIGCESDEECRAYLRITNQKPTEARPFVPTAVCRE